MKRINDDKELLEFTIERYNYYNSAFLREDKGSVYDSFTGVTHFYLKDFLNDLLVIQRYAAKEKQNGNGEGG